MTSKVWGGRFKKPIDPRIARFNASIRFDQVLFEQDIIGSQAHASMLARQGLLSEEEALQICNALETIKQEIKKGLHPVDETYEDIHMFIEHLLIEKIGDTGKNYTLVEAEMIRSLWICGCMHVTLVSISNYF